MPVNLPSRFNVTSTTKSTTIRTTTRAATTTTAKPSAQGFVWGAKEWETFGICFGVGVILGVLWFLFLHLFCMPDKRLYYYWPTHKRKRDEGKKEELKDKPATSAQGAPSARPALAIGDPDSKSKSTNSNETRNSTPLASPAAPAPTVPPVQSAPVPIKILDAAKGTVAKEVTAVQLAAAIEGGLERAQKDDESVDDVSSDWGKTQSLKPIESDKSGVSGVSGADKTHPEVKKK